MDAEAVTKLLLALPGVEEHVGWAGQPAFKVRKKGFVYLSADETSVMLKALREEQEALVAENPDIYTPSWASGRFAWLEVRLAIADEDELVELLTEAWRLTAPKMLITHHDSA